MKSFLGLVFYFRDHVRGFSELAQPWRSIMEGQSGKNQRLQWTETLRSSFRSMQDAVISCPKNRFLQPCHPIFVQTDASDYGIGAYMFQLVHGQSDQLAIYRSPLTRWRENGLP